MSTVIWKYPISITGPTALMIPSTAEILSIQLQGEQVVGWVKLKPKHAVVDPRYIVAIGTGVEGEFDESKLYRHIDTLQLMNGSFIIHFFEIIGEVYMEEEGRKS